MPATSQQLAVLNQVNELINRIPYSPDNPVFGEAPDTWKFQPDGKGFLCRDYEQAKADQLRVAGWDVAMLRSVLCFTEPVNGFPNGEYHAVLAVDFGDQTMILDNRFPQIYEWDECPAPYRWMLEQVAGTDQYLPVVA